MGMIQVTITDATGSRRDEVEVPNNFPVIKVIASLVKELGLPLTDPSGQPMSYRFHHMQSQSQLRDEASLDQSGVSSGDTLRLLPEITAG
jgi:uncharacterized ubiquitin-like protein YukD